MKAKLLLFIILILVACQETEIPEPVIEEEEIILEPVFEPTREELEERLLNKDYRGLKRDDVMRYYGDVKTIIWDRDDDTEMMKYKSLQEVTSVKTGKKTLVKKHVYFLLNPRDEVCGAGVIYEDWEDLYPREMATEANKNE